MELNYNGGAFTDCDVVSYVFGVPCAAAVTVAPIQFMQQAMWDLGRLHSFLINRALTFQEVVGEINNGRPVILGYNGSFNGHVVVLYGYDSLAMTVSIHDPYFGTYTQLPFGAAFTYGGSLVWNQTIYGIALGTLSDTNGKQEDGCTTQESKSGYTLVVMIALSTIVMATRLRRLPRVPE